MGNNGMENKMEKKDFLFEIGTEEIPARFLPSARQQLQKLSQAALAENHLAYESLRVFITPRRLAVLAQGVDAFQPDTQVEQKGPALKSAYDSEGKPSRALEGFCKSQNVAPADLVEREVKGNVYLFAIKEQPGRPASEVLPEICLQLIQKLNFPKPMRWGYEEMRFARPIRWLVALWGAEVLPLTVAGVQAGRYSRGHRVLGSQAVEIETPARYEAALEENYVIADPDKRAALVRQQVQACAEALGGVVDADEELLEEVIYLVEYPTALSGGFEEKYLDIPAELVITPMKEHQRYFPVFAPNGGLKNRFITVRNGDARFLDIVAAGNEKVLRARLADAAFFWTEDCKESLENWLPQLEKIVFHEKLGTLAEKVARMRALGAYLSEVLGYAPAERAKADRAISLMKADLLSRVVYEFAELQGIMGEYYARKDGEDAEVAQAIREHYLPRFAEDGLPESAAGKIAALVEKMDSLVGFFAVGIQPTGSQDPYALRRAAAGIVQIILQNRLEISLAAWISAAYAPFAQAGYATQTLEEVIPALTAFLGQRLENILDEQGVRYDVLNAVRAAGYDNLYQASLRAQALRAYAEKEAFGELIAGFTRAANILKKNPAPALAIQPALLVEPSEKALYTALGTVQERVAAAYAAHDYAAALDCIGSLRGAIDAFFTEVMVMTEEADLRQNRLALLGAVTALTSGIGDLAAIVSK